MFVIKLSRSLLKSRAPQRGFAWVGSGLTYKHRQGWKVFPRAYILAYYENLQITAVKSSYTLAYYKNLQVTAVKSFYKLVSGHQFAA